MSPIVYRLWEMFRLKFMCKLSFWMIISISISISIGIHELQFILKFCFHRDTIKLAIRLCCQPETQLIYQNLCNTILINRLFYFDTVFNCIFSWHEPFAGRKKWGKMFSVINKKFSVCETSVFDCIYFCIQSRCLNVYKQCTKIIWMSWPKNLFM